MYISIIENNPRYGADEPVSSVRNVVLDGQLAHRSVRKCVPGEVSEDRLRALVAAAQSAPTSSNLQPWSVVAVRDPARKARLAALAAGQQFVSEAVFLVWVADLGRARRLASRVGVSADAADCLETTLIGFVDTSLSRPRGPWSPRSRSASAPCSSARSATTRARLPRSSASRPTGSRPSASPSASPTRPRTPASSRAFPRPRCSTTSTTTPPAKGPDQPSCGSAAAGA